MDVISILALVLELLFGFIIVIQLSFIKVLQWKEIKYFNINFQNVSRF
jgi:hypothetical protein